MTFAIKFGGFYGGLHEDKINDMINQYEDEGDTFKREKELNIMYAREYLDFLCLELNVNMIFVELDSPSFYNFRTDEIIAKVEDEQAELYKEFIEIYIDKNELNEELEGYINNMTTPSSGYIPFYTKEDVYNPENIDMLLECMLKVVCDNIDDEWDLYYDRNGLYEMVYQL